MQRELRNPAFARMISDYVRLRGATALPPRAVEKLRAHLVDLFETGQPPPVRGRGIDWGELAADAGIEPEVLDAAGHALRPGLEALRRELAKPLPPGMRPRSKSGGRAPRRIGATLRGRKSAQASAGSAATRPGRKPVAVVEFPEPTPGEWEDVPEFHAALALHMRRHGDTAHRLRRALAHGGHDLDTTTIGMWRRGIKAPAHRDSFAALAALERRWRLPAGYFRAKLPHPARATTGQALTGIGNAERRRLAWHLPDDFDRRAPAEQEEILDWIRRVVVTGATEYRRYQAAALKHRFGLRFPGIQATSDKALCAPPGLAQEMNELVAFKKAVLTPIGLQRRGVWGDETAAQG